MSLSSNRLLSLLTWVVLIAAVVGESDASSKKQQQHEPKNVDPSSSTCIASSKMEECEKKIQELAKENNVLSSQIPNFETQIGTLESEKTSLETQLASQVEQCQVQLNEKTEEIQQLQHQHTEQVKDLKSQHEKNVQQVKEEQKKTTLNCQEKCDQHVNKLKTDMEKQKVSFETQLKNAKVGFHFDVWSREKVSQTADLLSDVFDWTAAQCVVLHAHVHRQYQTVSTHANQVYVKSVAPWIQQHSTKIVQPVTLAYQEHVQPKLKPLFALGTQTKAMIQPHWDATLPILQNALHQIIQKLVHFATFLKDKANVQRIKAITYLKQFPEIQGNAHRIVDFSIGILLAPFLYILFIKLVKFTCSLLFSLVATIICVLTLGCCCRNRKVKSNEKKKNINKKKNNPLATKNKKNN